MNFYAGQKPGADLLYALNYADTYVPTLTATVTNPDLGADGSATGWYQRNGLLISGEASFLFSGAGLSAGSGTFLISLPFDPDLSVQTGANTLGTGTIVGAGRVYDSSTAANSQIVDLQLRTDGAIGLGRSGTNSFVTDSAPVAWATGDRIWARFEYVADSADLPFGT